MATFEPGLASRHLFDPTHLPTDARLRSGTAARLAGVPVATLRVWERRYGVVAAPKTPTGQRLYSPHDVQRLRLLRQLTDAGHAIGTMAALDLAALQDLAARAQTPAVPAGPLQVIGRTAAQRLRAASDIEPQAVHEDLDTAERHVLRDGTRADVLLVHLPSLQPALARRVIELRQRLHARTLVVVYAFGAETVAATLRAAGAAVRREPVGGRELAALVCAPIRPDTAPALPAASVVGGAKPRRFSDEALAAIVELPSPVACECQRHVAELVMQLAGFERYSADCTSSSPADAALHRQLSALAASSRTLFEQALQQVMSHGGQDFSAVQPRIDPPR